jgi:hypothetical protein
MKETPPKSPKNKRSDPLSYKAWNALRDRLCAQLLPPRPGALSTSEQLDRLVAGEDPDPRHQWDLRQRKLLLEIDLCRFYERSEPADDYMETPWQIDAMREDLESEGWEDPSESDAISCLLSSTLELEKETRDYLAKEWMRLVPLSMPPTPGREKREFAETIKNLKRLLRERGVSMEKAVDVIAATLGTSSAALRQRLQRAPRK